MNDLDQNRIRRLENTVAILTEQLIQANHEIARLHLVIGELAAIDSTPEWTRSGAKIEGRTAALLSLKPRETRW
ncbi:hypothetical protein ACQ4M3_08925 [Leptolyngbya sp. AN03gr2]|uniref:hypothetical protein n=1 Tax=unclassified Leptolyngbya TaxID=2650499 RepID=UPI003D31DF75